MSTERPHSGESVTRVEFTLRDAPYPFVSATAAMDCEFELAEMLPHGGGHYAEFFNVMDADPERVLDRCSEYDGAEATLLREFENGGLFEFLVDDACPAVTLAEEGALPRAVRSADGDGHIVAEVPPQYDATAVIDTFLAENPCGELVCKQERASFTPMFTDSAARHVFRSRLTDRQRDVLRAAFEDGYYEWPRECTGEDVAAELGISSATFSEHIHAAERKLLATLFGEQD